MADWTEPGVMTDPGKYASLFDELPSDVSGMFRIGHGLMIHEFWADAYGVTLPDAPPRRTVNLRRVEDLLGAIVSRDDRPLSASREPAGRVPTNCRGFTVLAVAMLRAKGIPARSRCGFGAYFTPGFYEDHWVAEFFDGTRWRLADAQLDGFQRDRLKIRFDVTDVPRDQFVVAGDAWRQVRAGQADPSRFGLTAINEAGDWWIAGNLTRDAAALVDLEMLPWDTWGAMPEPDDDVPYELFDDLAAATAEPSLDGVRRLLRDDRLRVPDQVFNVQRQRVEDRLTSGS
jgi:hypothetical protein